MPTAPPRPRRPARAAGQITDSQARRDDLRERGRVDDALPARELVERRQRLALEAHQPVGVVLEHEQVGLAGKPERSRRVAAEYVRPLGFWKVGIA